MSEAQSRKYECCFCGDSIAGDDPCLVHLLLLGPEDSSQELWGHASCLRRAVRPAVPLFIPEECEERE
ncbi:MAG TPA: hypothetical protein VNK04_17700 [Gemmataceae bacterium]|nr:hypothetical protein [Gemmataceae bacterium]